MHDQDRLSLIPVREVEKSSREVTGVNELNGKLRKVPVTYYLTQRGVSSGEVEDNSTEPLVLTLTGCML